MTTHWRPDELEQSLLELADLMRERMRERGITKVMIANTGLVSTRTLLRWFKGEHLPRWPGDVENMLKAAEAAGVPRHESESLLPETVKLSAVTEFLSTDELILKQLRENGRFLSEIRDFLEKLGVQLDSLESHRSQRPKS